MPPAGRLPLWQLVVQPALKRGWIWLAKLTAGPQLTQVPPRQTEPAAQACPQAPQWAASELVSTHPPPQAVLPPAQVSTQLPLTQAVPAPQGWLQPPQ